jgi:hypothetical protein
MVKWILNQLFSKKVKQLYEVKQTTAIAEKLSLLKLLSLRRDKIQNVNAHIKHGEYHRNLYISPYKTTTLR